VPEGDTVRLDIMFEGGASLSVTVSVATADELDRALASGEGDSLGFDGDDGRYTLALRKIVFARRSTREQVVGFGQLGG
jgi:hypothetical protein